MISPKELFEKERQQSPLTACLLLMVTISGFATYVYAEHTHWQQWMVILHTLVGVLVSFAIMPYTFHHFRRALSLRRPIVSITGLVTVALLALLIATGSHIIYFGRLEKLKWVYDYHVMGAAAVLALLAIHLLGHALFSPKRRVKKELPFFETLKGKIVTPALMAVVICVVVPLGAAAVQPYFDYPFRTESLVENYSKRYGEHPFRPSQTETFSGKFIDEKQIGNSLECISCHEDIGKQWFASTHRMAASDNTYVTNVSLLAGKKGIEATRYCEGCHAPIALLTGQLSLGGKHGGIEGTMANQEGVPCMGCHGIDKIMHLQGVASFEFKPRSAYLFEGYDSELLKKLNHFMIRVSPSQHKQDLKPDILQSSEYCATCHAQFMDKDMNNWGWVKMQDEYSAWLAGPFSRQEETRFGQAEVVNCQECHMAMTESTDPSANGDGHVRSHYFTAANTVLPLLANDKEQVNRTTEFLQMNKMHISIEEPNRKDATQNRLALDEKIRDRIETPWYLYLNEEVEINVLVSNVGVGHNFPGGTIDLNEAWIEFVVMDSNGQLVYSSGHMTSDNFVEPNAYFYRSREVDRNGNLVWRHDLFNRVGEASKNVIKAGGTDLVPYKFQVPAWAQTPLTISATLKYRKLNEQYARWALKDAYQLIPIVDMARDSLSVPLKLQKEIM